ncbi:pyruvate formate-lyase-activating protein [Jonesia quinghaiensis]|uniref:pyruvate formate-lyase-activating protein n=1 Tax=Jonesia quinghaiensis TaxID=262806 RepID=UPI000400BEC6|nr:pyruvate formate-lyase-activating protein [Jonesia quinghaiensis]
MTQAAPHPCTIISDGRAGTMSSDNDVDVEKDGLAVPGKAAVGRQLAAGINGLGTADVDRHEKFEQMRAGLLGSVHSWELVTAVDGPGTRMTLFLAGCPLRCLYCHNPDTMKMKDGEPVTADEIVKRISRYQGIFEATDGGLTISGGEVLMQPAFAANILHQVHAKGIHTTIDTSGYLGAACTDEMLKDIDLVLLDVKAGDEETYKKVTGRSLQPTLDFGQRLADAGKEIWIRFVLVPGLTDSFDNVEKIADFVAAWSTVSRVEVLPFHQMGRDKWANLGLKYELDGTQPPSKEDTERVRDQFRARGLTVY